jgi:hypothetical protein
MHVHILYLNRRGRGLTVAAKLREHHEFMDSKLVTDGNVWSPTGRFEILVCQGQHRLQFNWFSRCESFVFGYILSGIMNLADITSTKAQNFLYEGRQLIAGAPSLPLVRVVNDRYGGDGAV